MANEISVSAAGWHCARAAEYAAQRPGVERPAERSGHPWSPAAGRSLSNALLAVAGLGQIGRCQRETMPERKVVVALDAHIGKWMKCI